MLANFMPAPFSPLMVCPAPSSVMPSAPIIIPWPIGHFRSFSRIVSVVIVSPHDIAFMVPVMINKMRRHVTVEVIFFMAMFHLDRVFLFALI